MRFSHSAESRVAQGVFTELHACVPQWLDVHAVECVGHPFNLAAAFVPARWVRLSGEAVLAGYVAMKKATPRVFYAANSL